MSLLNTNILPFKAQAFHQGQFIEVTEASMKGRWAVVFFYPADFTFVCPTELEDLAEQYAEFQKRNVEIYAVSTDILTSHIRLGMKVRPPLVRFNFRWWAILR